jgi:hypothetical protein
MNDYIATVEAAYDLTGTASDWLYELGASARPWLDRGLGVMLWGFDISNPKEVRLDKPLVLGGPQEYAERTLRYVASMTPEHVLRTVGSARICDSASEAFEGTLRVMRPTAERRHQRLRTIWP